MNQQQAEIVVRDATTRKMVGGVYFGHRDETWYYEAYDGSEKRIGLFPNAHEALEALLDYLS